MAGASNSVTLTFVADTKSLDKGFKDVQAGGAATTKTLQDTEVGVQAMGAAMEKSSVHSMTAAKGFREAATGVLLMSNEMPKAVSQTALLAVSVGDLAGAYQRLSPTIAGAWSKMGLFTKSLALAGGAGVAAFAGWEIGTAIGNKLNDMLGRTPSAAEQAADAIRKNTDAVIAYAGALGYANAQQSALLQTKALTDIQFHNQNGQVQNETQGFIQGPVPLDATGRLLNSTNGGNSYAAAEAAKKAADAAAAASKAAASKSASSAISAAQQAANAALAKWQTTLDKARQIGAGIADALSPKLEAADQGLLLFKGPSLLDKLNKQLTDTKHLAADIKSLTKAGLSGDLIGQLVQGGLSSLPAADELLAGGKGSIAQANKLSAGITKTANTIATNEATRQTKQNIDITLKVDPAANGDVTAAFVKMMQKYVRTNAGGSVQLALGGKG